jgi:hypothetical protein
MKSHDGFHPTAIGEQLGPRSEGTASAGRIRCSSQTRIAQNEDGNAGYTYAGLPLYFNFAIRSIGETYRRIFRIIAEITGRGKNFLVRKTGTCLQTRITFRAYEQSRMGTIATNAESRSSRTKPGHARFILSPLRIFVAVRTPQEENGAVFPLDLFSRSMCHHEGNPDR